jgi:hypothetical protein
MEARPPPITFLAAAGRQHPQLDALGRQAPDRSGASRHGEFGGASVRQNEGFPFKVVRGYPGTNDAVLAMERGEVDGVFVHRASMRADLIASGFAVPIFQTFAIEPDLPVLEQFVTNPREIALLDLLNAPQRLGLAVIAPPALPADITTRLRTSYLTMVASKEYQEEAARRGLDVGKPNTGEELADYVASKLVTFPSETIREYRDYVERP